MPASTYASNLISVENVINELDDDADAICRVKELLQEHRDKISEDLYNLKKYYTLLVENVTRLETDCVPMESSLSCYVERSLSVYKKVLVDNRRSFIFELRTKHVVIICCNDKNY